MIRSFLIVNIAIIVTAGAIRVTRRTAPTAADCGTGTAIRSEAVAAAVRSIVLDSAIDQGGQKKWCARSNPLFVISPAHPEIRACPRIVFVGDSDEALRRADTTGDGTDYIKIDLERDARDQFVEIMAERGRIVKASDAVQVEIMRKRQINDIRPTFFREQLSHYRVTATGNRVEICGYSNIVI